MMLFALKRCTVCLELKRGRVIWSIRIRGCYLCEDCILRERASERSYFLGEYTKTFRSQFLAYKETKSDEKTQHIEDVVSVAAGDEIVASKSEEPKRSKKRIALEQAGQGTLF